MILKIFLILIVSVILLIGCVVFSPVYFTYNNKRRPYDAATLIMHVIHPAVVCLTYVFSLKKYEMLLFNRYRIGSLKKEEPHGAAEEPFEGYEETVERQPEKEEPPPKEVTAVPEEKKEPERETVEYAVPEPEPSPPRIPPQPPEKEREKEREKEQRDAVKEVAPEKREEETKGMEEMEEPAKSTFGRKYNKFKMILHFIINQKKIAAKAVRWLQRFLGRCLRLITFDYLSVHIRAGFTDPAITGALHGFFTGMYHGLEIEDYRKFSIEFEPQFKEEDIFLCKGYVRIKTSLAQLLRPVVIGLLTFPYISAFILWRRIKKFKTAIKQN